MLLVLCFSAFLFSLLLTWLVRKYSIANSLIDIPNHRSSHSASMPRGGGLGISVILLFTIYYLYYLEYLSANEFVGIFISVLAVTLSGWIDDHKHIPSFIRATIYLFASIWLLYYINVGWPLINWLVSILVCSLFITWIINLYNFMDGIDGLAATEALTTSAFAFLLFYQQGEPGLYLLSAILFSIVCGFLFWNWPPARIFMGDVGSCTLGLIFCIIALLAYKKLGISVAIWLLLLSVFIADATYTLLKRILRKEKWYAAHRQHAYQLLVQAGYSHGFVTSSVAILNIIILWPLAYYLFHNKHQVYLILAITYISLFFLWSFIHIHYKNRLDKEPNNKHAE